MESINGHGPTNRAILYARVSTEEQASSGYSLGQQREALQGYCQQNDLEVVATFEDRSSRAYLGRPGLDSLRDLVADGGVEIDELRDQPQGKRALTATQCIYVPCLRVCSIRFYLEGPIDREDSRVADPFYGDSLTEYHATPAPDLSTEAAHSGE